MMQLTIIGLGNQAKSWALNLKDSGFPFRVALRPHSKSIQSAKALGLEVVEIGSEEFYTADFYALLTPDSSHQEFLSEHGPGFKQGDHFLYAHGFSVVTYEFEKKYPHLNHILFAPKSIGTELRNQYLIKGHLGAVYSLEHSSDTPPELEVWVKNLATALGITMGPYKTTFKKETEADLFSEQGLLCSLIPYTAEKMFQHLIENGVEKELAYFECWHELKLIVNAMVEKGPLEFFELISPNALVGAHKGHQRLMKPEMIQNLKSLMTEIQDGTFNAELEASHVEEIRGKIRHFWKNSDLQKTHEMLKREQK
jgi:ketol-acid reductoisomerase